MNIEQLKILKMAQELVENPLTQTRTMSGGTVYELSRGHENTVCFWYDYGHIMINRYRSSHDNNRYNSHHCVDGPAYFEMTNAGYIAIFYFLDNQEMPLKRWQEERLKWISN